MDPFYVRQNELLILEHGLKLAAGKPHCSRLRSMSEGNVLHQQSENWRTGKVLVYVKGQHVKGQRESSQSGFDLVYDTGLSKTYT